MRLEIIINIQMISFSKGAESHTSSNHVGTQSHTRGAVHGKPHLSKWLQIMSEQWICSNFLQLSHCLPSNSWHKAQFKNPFFIVSRAVWVYCSSEFYIRPTEKSYSMLCTYAVHAYQVTKK